MKEAVAELAVRESSVCHTAAGPRFSSQLPLLLQGP